ncbi:hypothetical protein FNJ84_12680 [Paracoccus sp. M683]|uniref:hypothetical protein n=1 Tax=Paracoccus sp. M683 TaxID=2594268 RepID=UPI001180F2AC|nr:hypothetical protein [Paracoccus sp. M683]TRW96905.1 hypothetical protein FNJ84_12680 [Paracoccus sp. M683]
MSEELRDIPAFDAFLNAALREGAIASVHDDKSALRIPTAAGELVVRVTGRACFRWRFGPCLRLAARPCSVAEALPLLSQPFGEVFAGRVRDSLGATRRAGWAPIRPRLLASQSVSGVNRRLVPCC